jgi:hypothetical protein
MFDDVEDTLYDNDKCSRCGNYGTMEDGLCELCFADTHDPDDPANQEYEDKR